MNVNLGCGPYTPKGWINVDADPQYGADLIAQSWDLPFPDSSVGCVYCGHVLEHMSYDIEAPATLREILRVLVPEGRLLVVGPDMDVARELGAEQWILDAIENRRPEGHAESPGWHQWTATAANTLELVRSVFPAAVQATDPERIKWAKDDEGVWYPVACPELGQLVEQGWFVFSMTWWQVAIKASK